MADITYLQWLSQHGYADRTIEQRVIMHDNRLREWGRFDVPQHVIAEWLGEYDGWSRLTYHAHLISLYDWLVDTGQMPVNPVRGIRRPPSPSARAHPLSEDELARALRAARSRTRAYLLCGYLAGLRAHEIAKMHGRDITETRLRVLGKGGRDDSLPTHPLLWQLAQTYPRMDFWFPSRRAGHEHVNGSTVTEAVSALFRSLGIEGATHRARHTYATTLLRQGANLRVVQDLMRHRSLSTTAAYLGVDEDERRDAIRSLAA